MATATRNTPASPNVLRNVPWDVYQILRDAEGNRHLRMNYHDGTLVLMSPEYIHDRTAERVSMIVRAVVSAFGIQVAGTRSTTFRRRGEGLFQGDGKEPGTGFYIAHEARVRGKRTIDLDIDPPPDLAVEVDNTTDSTLALPTYASLGVPEVWRYDIETDSLWFGRLGADGEYQSIDRSDGLPMLTPAIVLERLTVCGHIDETTWDNELRAWARDVLLPGYRGV